MSSLERKKIEVAALGYAILSRPELMGEYTEKSSALREFDERVRVVLESHFQPAQYKSAIAILSAIPYGDLSFIFSAWLDELVNLGALTQAQTAEIREGQRHAT